MSKNWCLWGFYGSMWILSSCSVNRALVDPWSYAPEDSYCFWRPDVKGRALAEERECLPDLPRQDHLLSLAEVLDIALLNSPTTRMTWAEARVSAAEYAQSQSALLPNITGSYSLQTQRMAYLSNQFIGFTIGPITLFESTVTQWGPQMQLSYNILDFGQRRATSEAARYALYYSNYTHNRAIQTLLETITADYYDYLYQLKLQEAYEADLATAQETYDAATLALKQGVQNISDQLQAITQLLQAEIRLIEQQQAIVDSRARLLKDMGLQADAAISLQKMPTDYPEQISLAPLDEWVAIAKECRPDLLAARASVRSADESLVAANRAWLPNLNYSLNFGRTYFNGGFHDNYDYTSILSVNMPIFSGFWYRNNIRKAEASQRQSEANLREVELTTIQEMTSAYSNVTVTLSTLRSANGLEKAAAEQYRVAIAQYRAGTGNILEVVSAQSTLFDARAKVASAMQQWLTSLATLSYSAGTLSKPPSYE